MPGRSTVRPAAAVAEPGEAGAKVRVEVVVAHTAHATCITLLLPAGATVAEALEAARERLGAEAPGPATPVGIYGREVARSRVLRPGDRLEIYRPLAADPKETRRRLAREGRTMGRSR